MSLTIFGVYQYAALPKVTLRKIIEMNTKKGVINSQAVYDEINKRKGWTIPKPGNNDQVGIDFSYETAGAFFLPDGHKAGMKVFDENGQVEVIVFLAPLQRTSPHDVILEMQQFEEGIRESIEDNIRELILNKGQGSTLKVREDPYHGYPSVYAQDARCSICELKGASIRKNGSVAILIGECDKHNFTSDPMNTLPICELLQIWSILIATVAQV